MLRQLAGHDNVVVLTGDEHQNFAGELRTSGSTGNVVAVAFINTLISAGRDGAEKRVGADRILADNPFLRWSNDRSGYIVCEVTADAFTIRYWTVDRSRSPMPPSRPRPSPWARPVSRSKQYLPSLMLAAVRRGPEICQG